MKQVLTMIALSIGIGVLAITAICPEFCHAAGEGSGSATVVRSIFVNQNGGADFTSIQKAINSVPFGNNQWIRIHVAAGVYKEKVSIPMNKSFIMLEGEGRQQTSIEWADFAGGGDSGTADSPTFASYAPDFIARDITFKNTYGVASGRMAPAVAALVAGDRSSFYRCGFVGVQDTLSDLLGRHYYEGCYIEGAVDFIFGEGQSIFHGCDIWAASPVARASRGAPGYITAQGRSSAADASGFVFRSCTVGGAAPAYLGRAWRGYARVVFYQSDLSAAVVSLGWDAWGYKGKEETLEMVEEGCTGPGANRTGRVAWEKTLSDAELGKLVDISYVSHDGWLAVQPR
uniref:Pectinesterase n=1 Tax=Leersia perrieri TaxID=77586 RepID=A0A0D9V020_9ORYZ